MKNEMTLGKAEYRDPRTPGCARWRPIVLYGDPAHAEDDAQSGSAAAPQADLKSPEQQPEAKENQPE